MNHHATRLALACLLLGQPSWSAEAGPIPLFRGWQAYEENDSLVFGDERYTQGLKVTLNFSPERIPGFAKRLSEWMVGRVSPDAAVALDPAAAVSLGQNIYTPRIITSPIVDPADRAFSGFAYLGGQVAAVDKNQTVRHTLEMDVGLFGRESLARFAQAGLHVLKTSRIPKGWGETEPRHGLGIHFAYRGEERVGRTGNEHDLRWDLTAGQVAEAGLVRNAYGAHAAVRVGYRLTGFPSSPIQPALRDVPPDRPVFEIGGIAGFEGRAVFHTRLVQPTEGTQRFQARHAVGDARVGGFVRLSSFRITVQKVWRSPEFQIAGVPPRSQSFASIAASYEPGLDRDIPRLVNGLRRVATHLEFELGMGRTLHGPELRSDKPAGITGHAALRIKAYRSFTLGLEAGGTGIESDLVNSRAQDSYSDLFLRQGSATIGWRPGGPRGRLALRAGSDILGPTAYVQTVRHPRIGEGGSRVEDSDNYTTNQAKRGGWLVGAQYFVPVERHVAFGVDVTYRSMKVTRSEVDVPGLVTPRFVNAIFGIQIRP